MMLNGTTVLVIEEEFLIALDIQRMLESLGVGQVLFARSVEEALSLQEHWKGVSLAVVEIQLKHHQSDALIATLQSLGIGVILCSADSALRHGVPRLPGVPVVCKPMAEHDLVRAIGLVLDTRP